MRAVRAATEADLEDRQNRPLERKARALEWHVRVALKIEVVLVYDRVFPG